MEELAEWRVYVDAPAPTLRKITHDTVPKRGKVVATPGPREGERVWWVDGVTYTADPETIRVLAHRRWVVIEDAPDGIPAGHTKRVEEEQRRRAEAERRRAERAARREARKRQKDAPTTPS